MTRIFIQIQLLLKLNLPVHLYFLDMVHSNTTLVKVKSNSVRFNSSRCKHSNTTLVKVKSILQWALGYWVYDSNTTLVKVKLG